MVLRGCRVVLGELSGRGLHELKRGGDIDIDVAGGVEKLS
jgi:hypothetical protein